MARVDEVMVPTYVVRETLGKLLTAWSRLTTQDQLFMWGYMAQQSVNRGSNPMGTLITIPCPSSEEAERLAKAINTLLPNKKITVPSTSRRHMVHYVEIDADNKPVSCTCEDYTFSVEKSPDHVCKHMSAVRAHPSHYGVKMY